MLKVSQCWFCGKYSRTGKVRGLIIRERVASSEGKKSEIKEAKVIVCKVCYGKIEIGEAIDGGFHTSETIRELFDFPSEEKIG